MVEFVSCQCPNCKATLSIESGRDSAFCTYCGTKFLLNDTSVTTHYEIHREINDADIIREKAKEKIANRKLDNAEKSKDFKRNLMLGYICACVLLAVITFLLLKFSHSPVKVYFLLVTILLATVPIVLKITQAIVKYGETVVTTDTETSWFGFKKESTQHVHSPVAIAALIWLIYLGLVFMISFSVYPRNSSNSSNSEVNSTIHDETSSQE